MSSSSADRPVSRAFRRFGVLSVVVALTAPSTVAGSAALAATSPRPGHRCSPSVTRENFGHAYDKYARRSLTVYRYTLANCRGLTAKILSYGAITQEIDVPDRHGRAADVVLGFRTLADYVKYASPPVTSNGGPYFGEIVGRYANRIAGGTFRLNGKTYTLPVNNGANSLHGGLVGFGNHVWAARAVTGNGSAGVQLTLVSPNRDESYPAGSPGCPHGCTGYPARLRVVVTYTLDNAGRLGIRYDATNQSPTESTVVNLTNHSYFNLAGEASGAGTAYRQRVRINADRYSPTDTSQLPLPLTRGVPVKGTPFDFTSPRTVGSRIDDVSAPDNVPARFRAATKGEQQLLIAQGYDHNWILNRRTGATTGPYGLNLAAVAGDAASGRRLTVWTDQPGVQFYSANFLTGTLVGISGHTYRQGAGYTFETQHFPNSPNERSFPSTVLEPGKTFRSTTVLQFSS